MNLKHTLNLYLLKVCVGENHGEWHVDHIKDVSLFNNDELPSVVNALSNLRPMWATTREINGIIYEGNLNRNKHRKRKL